MLLQRRGSDGLLEVIQPIVAGLARDLDVEEDELRAEFMSELQKIQAAFVLSRTNTVMSSPLVTRIMGCASAIRCIRLENGFCRK